MGRKTKGDAALSAIDSEITTLKGERQKVDENYREIVALIDTKITLLIDLMSRLAPPPAATTPAAPRATKGQIDSAIMSVVMSHSGVIEFEWLVDNSAKSGSVKPESVRAAIKRMVKAGTLTRDGDTIRVAVPGAPPGAML